MLDREARRGLLHPNDWSHSSINDTDEVLFHFVGIEPPDDTGRFT
jgi:hypothetical protein